MVPILLYSTHLKKEAVSVWNVNIVTCGDDGIILLIKVLLLISGCKLQFKGTVISFNEIVCWFCVITVSCA